MFHVGKEGGGKNEFFFVVKKFQDNEAKEETLWCASLKK